MKLLSALVAILTLSLSAALVCVEEVVDYKTGEGRKSLDKYCGEGITACFRMELYHYQADLDHHLEVRGCGQCGAVDGWDITFCSECCTHLCNLGENRNGTENFSANVSLLVAPTASFSVVKISKL